MQEIIEKLKAKIKDIEEYDRYTVNYVAGAQYGLGYAITLIADDIKKEWKVIATLKDRGGYNLTIDRVEGSKLSYILDGKGIGTIQANEEGKKIIEIAIRIANDKD